MRVVTILVLLIANLCLLPAKAQEIDFGRIRSFESIGSGEVHGGAPPKAIVDDGEPHAVVLTIWDSDTDAKVFWTSLDGDQPRTTLIHGTTVRAFQTAGELKVQAVGNANQKVKYDYMLLRVGKED
jgi:hypothetical protein